MVCLTNVIFVLNWNVFALLQLCSLGKLFWFPSSSYSFHVFVVYTAWSSFVIVLFEHFLYPLPWLLVNCNWLHCPAGSQKLCSMSCSATRSWMASLAKSCFKCILVKNTATWVLIWFGLGSVILSCSRWEPCFNINKLLQDFVKIFSWFYWVSDWHEKILFNGLIILLKFHA